MCPKKIIGWLVIIGLIMIEVLAVVKLYQCIAGMD